MSLSRDDLPYSNKRLEDLAVAMGVNSAYLWVNPSNNTFCLRDSALKKERLVSDATIDIQENKEKN